MQNQRDDVRPDPDQLLETVQTDETLRSGGRLKVFLGMCPGVGKTYAMLSQAGGMVERGVDLVVGYLETHGRRETEDLAQRLEIMPRRKMPYRGIVLEDMDIDAVLARRPALVLVDELAHTNAPGSRHPRRYQDVIELIEHGIDVFTTVNVQHLESQADSVEQLTGIRIHERVPDSILDRAAEIEVVDVSPEVLDKRLSEGKVYTPDRAEVAARNFFRRQNLIALREMALTTATRFVDREVKANLTTGVYEKTFRSRERILIMLGTHPGSARLIRLSRRLAQDELAELFAIHVDTGVDQDPAVRGTIMANLELARQMGAELLTGSGDLVEVMSRLTRQKGITQIVMGKSPAVSFFRRLFRGRMLAEVLLESCPGVDIHIVPDRESEIRRLYYFQMKPRSSGQEYLVSLGTILGVTAFNWFVHPFTSYLAPSIFYLFMVAMLGAMLGRGPVLMAATLSALLWNWLFIPPQFTFFINKLEDVLMLFSYYAVAAATSVLTGRIRKNNESLIRSEKTTAILYEFSQDMARATGSADALRVAAQHLEKAFLVNAIVLLERNGSLERPPEPGTIYDDEKERALADWVLKNRKPGGRFSDTLPEARYFYTPLWTVDGVIGVAGLELKTALDISQEHLFQSMNSQIAAAVDRSRLAEQERELEAVQESERLFRVVMNTLSHELRSPLTAIMGSAGALLDDVVADRKDLRRGLLEELLDSAERMKRLVNNLLDLSRLESGHLELKRDSTDLRETVEEGLYSLKRELKEHIVNTDLAAGVPNVLVDASLLSQAFQALLHNAAVHTPPGTRITIRLFRESDGLTCLSVADNGPGVSEEVRQKLFEKFFRGDTRRTGGTGLGLALARGILELHGGTLTARSPAGGGLEFLMHMPAGPAQAYES